jgi:hypothetical protein
MQEFEANSDDEPQDERNQYARNGDSLIEKIDDIRAFVKNSWSPNNIIFDQELGDYSSNALKNNGF